MFSELSGAGGVLEQWLLGPGICHLQLMDFWGKWSVGRALPVTIPGALVFLEKFLCLLQFCVTWGCTDSSPVPFPPGTGAQILSLMRGDLPLVSCAAGTALWAGGLLVFLLRWLFWSCLTNSSVCCELLWGKFPVVLDFRGAL